MSSLLGIAEALNASSKGKTVLILRFSIFDKELPDILVTLPSVEELQLFQSLSFLNPEWKHSIEESLCDKHVLSPIVRSWLREGFAGIPSFICEAFLEIGYTSDIDSVNGLLNSMRNSTPYYSQMKQLVTSSFDVSLQELRGLDLHQVLENALAAEKSLKDKGMLETPIQLQGTKRQVTGAANIDFEAERKKQIRELNNGGPSGQVSESEYYRKHPS